MKKFSKILALFLCVCTVSVPLASCKGSNDNKDGEQTTGGTEQQNQSNYYVPDVKYTGKFNILGPGPDDSEWECFDFYAESTGDDYVQEAVYQRQKKIEENFGVEINYIAGSRGTINDMVQTAVTSNSPDYDIVMQTIEHAYTLAQNSYLTNLAEVEHLDLTNAAWDQSLLKQTSISGQNYFATGDITTMDNDGTWTMMFNKQVATNLDVPDLYQLVKDKKWTMDKMLELSKNCYVDNNNDSNRDAKDTFGLATTIDVIQGLYFGGNGTFVSKDNSDIPYLNFANERNSKVIDKLISLYYRQNNITYDCHDFEPVEVASSQSIFEENRSLFYSEVMQCVTRLRNMNTDFGIIPMPMLDEAQENYTTHVVASVSLVACFMKNLGSEQLQRAGAVAQALAVEGKNILTPAYYDKSLISKGVRDEQSKEMLEIIFQNRVCDLGYVMDIGSLYMKIREAIRSGSNEMASVNKSVESKANKAINKIVNAFENIE